MEKEDKDYFTAMIYGHDDEMRTLGMMQLFNKYTMKDAMRLINNTQSTLWGPPQLFRKATKAFYYYRTSKAFYVCKLHRVPKEFYKTAIKL